jgi:mercuric ion transport protein
MKLHDSSLTRNPGLLASGALAGAIAASTCCVVPLILALTGVTGVWIGSLTLLSPYQPLFAGFAAACIGIGFWRTYRSNNAVCEGPECGTPTSRRATKAVLWIASAVLVVAATTSWWAPLFA